MSKQKQIFYVNDFPYSDGNSNFAGFSFPKYNFAEVLHNFKHNVRKLKSNKKINPPYGGLLYSSFVAEDNFAGWTDGQMEKRLDKQRV